MKEITRKTRAQMKQKPFLCRLTSFHRVLTLVVVVIIPLPPITHTSPHLARPTSVMAKTWLRNNASHLVNVTVFRGRVEESGREIVVGGCVAWFRQSWYPAPLPRRRQGVQLVPYPLSQSMDIRIQIRTRKGTGLGISLRREPRSAGSGRRIDVDESGCRSLKASLVPFAAW